MDDGIVALFLKMILAAILFGVGCFFAGQSKGRADVQREAVRAGVGSWEATEEGGVRFVWGNRVEL